MPCFLRGRNTDGKSPRITGSQRTFRESDQPSQGQERHAGKLIRKRQVKHGEHVLPRTEGGIEQHEAPARTQTLLPGVRNLRGADGASNQRSSKSTLFSIVRLQ